MRTLDYFYHPLANAPFTLGIALPQEYGKWRVEARIEPTRARTNRKCHARSSRGTLAFTVVPVSSELFPDDNFRLHPDWLYCSYNYAGDDTRELPTPEETLRHFLNRMQRPGWTWGTPSVRPLPKCNDQETFEPNCIKCKLVKVVSTNCAHRMIFLAAHGMDKMDRNSYVCE